MLNSQNRKRKSESRTGKQIRIEASYVSIYYIDTNELAHEHNNYQPVVTQG